MKINKRRPYYSRRSRLKERMASKIYVLPNLLTTGNLFFGFMSIIHSIRGNFVYASYAIVGAAIFDLLDGRVARMTRSTSKFGAEYDSLCDLVSFGMAPALLAYLWALHPFNRIGWLFSFFYVACGALRLARFNVQSEETSGYYFSGLPIPMAAGIVSSAVLCFHKMEWQSEGAIGLLAMIGLLSFVMVSNFPYKSFKEIDIRGRMPFHYLVGGVMIIAIIAYRPEVMLFALFLTYAILGAIFGTLNAGKKRLKKQETK